MTIHRTHWNTGELQALHKWIVAQGPVFATLPITSQVAQAQQAVLPSTRHRANVHWHSQAERVMVRMAEAVKLGTPTPQQAVQAPAFTTPLVPVQASPLGVVYLQRGSTFVVGMPPGKYLLEVM